MAKLSRPRRGSLQYWPRKRARKILPSANWNLISSKNNKNLLGFIGYKVGMKSAFAKDLTNDSMTKNQRISFPVTIVECPSMKIFSVRFYKNNKVINEVINSNIEKELKRAVKLPKKQINYSEKIDQIKDYDNIRLLLYSNVKKTGLKKKPDVAEIGIGGNINEQLSFIKENMGKEIRVTDVFNKLQLIDVHAVTKGKGLQGAVKRFGIGLRSHKAEKGRRRAGSLGPWHPARVTYMAPQAGQLGMFTRVVYNNKIVDIANINEKNINPSNGFKQFGNIKTDYLVIKGSIQGPAKRQVLITSPIRKTKNSDKKNYELIELR
ncbi:MAG TPA: 50S ribosomal protein L3 [Candidatus Paceibacterota bacterium]|nr:50S ribosomal protein L3 [Candidatus Paceibacterota bacterium]